MNKMMTLALVASMTYVSSGLANELISDAPADAQVYLISPQDGQTVGNNFKVHFGLSNMGVAPAGVDRDGTGHHHLLINTDVESLDLALPLPATDQIIHFGGGQTETTLTLPSGQHTLQLLLGNYAHIAHKKPVISKKITVVVD